MSSEEEVLEEEVLVDETIKKEESEEESEEEKSEEEEEEEEEEAPKKKKSPNVPSRRKKPAAPARRKVKTPAAPIRFQVPGGAGPKIKRSGSTGGGEDNNRNSATPAPVGGRKKATRRGGRRRPAKKNITEMLEQDEIVKEKTHFSTGAVIGVIEGSGAIGGKKNLDFGYSKLLSSLSTQEESEGECEADGKKTGYISNSKLNLIIRNDREFLDILNGVPEQEYNYNYGKDKDSGFKKLLTESGIIRSLNASRKVEKPTEKPIGNLPAHGGRVGDDHYAHIYACPRIIVEKSPKGKVINKKKLSLWEVNLVDETFIHLKKANNTVLSTMPCEDLAWVDMIHEQCILVLNFKKSSTVKKPISLKFENKLQMWKLYELCMLTVKEKPTFIPEFFDDSHPGLKHIKITGRVNYQIGRGKGKKVEISNEKKVLGKNSFFLCGGSNYDMITTYCVSWNLKKGKLPGITTKKRKGKTEELGRPEKMKLWRKIIRDGADIYAVCLQGLVKKKSGYYINYLKDFFDNPFDGNNKKFVLIHSVQSGDLGLYVFVDITYCRRITRINWEKRAYPKSMGNAQSVIVKMNINESPIAFVGVTLPTNPEMKERLYTQIFSDPNFMLNNHHVFLMGEFGYQINLPVPLSITYAKKGANLVNFDGLRMHREETGVLFGFKEGEIRYPPNEPVESVQEEYQTWKYCEKNPKKKSAPIPILKYSSRVLVYSHQYGPQSHVLQYIPNFSVNKISNSVPVCSVISIETRRTHISHFSKRTPQKEIRIELMYIGKHFTDFNFKSPQITMEGDWMEEISVSTTRKHKGNVVTKDPMFKGEECIPILYPVKSTNEFLSSCFLKLSIREDLGNMKGIRAIGLLSINTALKNKEGTANWFSIPMIMGSKKVCELMGVIKIQPKKE